MEDNSVERIPISAHDAKIGKYVIVKNHPCKVVDFSESKTGKHGHMKSTITGIDVLTNKKYRVVMPGHEKMTEFKIEKESYQLMNIADDTLDCLSSKNKQIHVKYEENSEIGKQLKGDFEKGKNLMISVIKAPVEIRKDVFEDDFVIEGYAEDKTVKE